MLLLLRLLPLLLQLLLALRLGTILQVELHDGRGCRTARKHLLRLLLRIRLSLLGSSTPHHLEILNRSLATERSFPLELRFHVNEFAEVVLRQSLLLYSLGYFEPPRSTPGILISGSAC